MLGFTEKEVGRFTFKKWSLLYEHFKIYHNFCIKQCLFKEGEKTSSHTEMIIYLVPHLEEEVILQNSYQIMKEFYSLIGEGS